LAWPCWPSRKCDCHGTRQGGRHPTWLRRRSAASAIWQFAHPVAMVLLDASFSEGLRAVGESERSIRLCAWSLCWLLHPRENVIVRGNVRSVRLHSNTTPLRCAGFVRPSPRTAEGGLRDVANDAGAGDHWDDDQGVQPTRKSPAG
jgi:hypothetical protein